MTVNASLPMFHKIRNIHMVGIGGSGMSGIAEVLRALDFTVTGSDLRLSPVTEKLTQLGISVHEGHRPDYVRDAHVVVYSSAVQPNNAEVVAAKERGIPVIPRSEMLGELTRMRFTIGIAGTHGKTTTTSMAGQILTTAGEMPTIIVGGIAKSLGSGGILGKGRYFVVEADEYARTFLHMFPTIAVVTSLEADHLDCYEDLDDIRDTFSRYLERLPFFGAAVMCIDDPNVRDLIPRVQRTVITYGLENDSDVTARELIMERLSSSFTVVADGADLGRVKLPIPGRHNVLNALAAVTVARELDVPIDAIREGLAAFSGVDRRFQRRGEVGGVTIIDDYAHHPTALRETLRTARNGWTTGRVVAVFQPHLYSRTRDFCEDFAAALDEADIAVVTDIYPSREKPIDGVTSDLISNAAREAGFKPVTRVGNIEDTVSCVRSLMKPGDMVLTIGAGDINRVGTALLDSETEAA